MGNSPLYYNFPIQLLNGFLIDHNYSLMNILQYHLYAHSLKLKKGTELEKYQESAAFFSVTLSDIRISLRTGKQLYDSIPDKSPMVGISNKDFFGYYKKEKTEFDKVCLLGFLAIKSILGTKAYCKITNKYWLSRMDGKTHSIEETAQLSEPLREYANEYQTRKIKNKLCLDKKITQFSDHNRGFFVSISLDKDKLALEAVKRKKDYQEKQLKREMAEAIKRAHAALKKP